MSKYIDSKKYETTDKNSLKMFFLWVFKIQIMFDYKGKTVLITGAGSGIGRSMAILFAQAGAKILLADLNVQASLEVQEMIINNGGEADYLSINVADAESVATSFSAINKLDVLINNAGIAHIGTIETTHTTDLERVFSVNVFGYFNMMKAAIPIFKKQKGGVILNIASVSALVGIPERFAYSTSKGAVMAMTLSVAKDYINEGIRCNSVSPARVHSPFVESYLEKNYPDNKEEMFEKLSKTQPIGRMAKPDEIANLALYLCSDEASFITGCDYCIDGGFVKLNN